MRVGKPKSRVCIDCMWSFEESRLGCECVSQDLSVQEGHRLRNLHSRCAWQGIDIYGLCLFEPFRFVNTDWRLRIAVTSKGPQSCLCRDCMAREDLRRDRERVSVEVRLGLWVVQKLL